MHKVCIVSISVISTPMLTTSSVQQESIPVACVSPVFVVLGVGDGPVEGMVLGGLW